MPILRFYRSVVFFFVENILSPYFYTSSNDEYEKIQQKRGFFYTPSIDFEDTLFNLPASSFEKVCVLIFFKLSCLVLFFFFVAVCFPKIKMITSNNQHGDASLFLVEFINYENLKLLLLNK